MSKAVCHPLSREADRHRAEAAFFEVNGLLTQKSSRRKGASKKQLAHLQNAHAKCVLYRYTCIIQMHACGLPEETHKATPQPPCSSLAPDTTVSKLRKQEADLNFSHLNLSLF